MFKVKCKPKVELAYILESVSRFLQNRKIVQVEKCSLNRNLTITTCPFAIDDFVGHMLVLFQIYK